MIKRYKYKSSRPVSISTVCQKCMKDRRDDLLCKFETGRKHASTKAWRESRKDTGKKLYII